MNQPKKFREVINTSYSFKGDSLLLGTGMVEDSAVPQLPVKMPLKTFNRHGLIAGATYDQANGQNFDA